MQLIFAGDLRVQADHGQIYFYPPGADILEGDPYLTSLADAVESRRFVGAAGSFIDLMTPGSAIPPRPCGSRYGRRAR